MSESVRFIQDALPTVRYNGFHLCTCSFSVSSIVLSPFLSVKLFNS